MKKVILSLLLSFILKTIFAQNDVGCLYALNEIDTINIPVVFISDDENNTYGNNNKYTIHIGNQNQDILIAFQPISLDSIIYANISSGSNIYLPNWNYYTSKEKEKRDFFLSAHILTNLCRNFLQRDAAAGEKYVDTFKKHVSITVSYKKTNSSEVKSIRFQFWLEYNGIY